MSLPAPCVAVELDVERLHARFLALVARVEVHARIAFRHVKCPSQKEDAIAEAVALAWLWFVRLARRGTDASAFVSALAGYAARAVRSGRRLCGQERAQDVLSPLAQQRRGFRVEPLPSSIAMPYEKLYVQPHGQHMQDVYEERLQDNTMTPVPDQVQFRIDFPTWLLTLTGRERRLIRAMARGERTKDLSRRFGVSPARISQLRREFQQGWRRFCGDTPASDQAGDRI